MIFRTAALALLTACAVEEGGSSEDSVELRFAWPASGHARVVETKVKDGVRAESEFSIRWEAGAEAGTTEVSIADVRMLSFNGRPLDEEASAALASSLDSMGLSLDSLALTMVIDANGQLLDTLGVDSMIDRAFASSAERGVLDEAEREEIDRRLNTDAARQLMGALGGKTWNPWVGSWAGLLVPVDGSISAEVRLPIPGADELVRVQQRITGLGVTADAEGRWLHLQLEHVYDPASLQAAMVQLFTAIDGAEPEGASLHEMERTDFLEVVTDVDSLQPRKAMMRFEMRAGAVSRKEQRRWEFDWSPEPR